MDAVILVDLQNDFLSGGAFEVPSGDEVIPVANWFFGRFELAIATQDWHPVNHVSFAANHPGRVAGERIELNGTSQVLWPIHCVQNTYGARLAEGLHGDRIQRVFPKGTDPLIDSYSGFFDNGHLKSTGLGEFLAVEGVHGCYILGLATDYCVKFTALDARANNFDTYLVLDGCRGVEMAAGDVGKSIDEMTKAGVKVIHSHEVG